MFTRKERWGPTWRAWLLLLVFLVGGAVLIPTQVHPFLAVTRRIPARVLVIEGWSSPESMREAAAEFNFGKYDQAILIRPVLDAADQYQSGRYSGHWLARTLVADGVPDAKLASLFPNVALKDRTYHSALAVREWLASQHISIDALDVASPGPHARRSRLLYEKAFGPGAKIGVIALHSDEYDPRHWWRTSEGVLDVSSESIAYLYVRIFFHPSASD